ncbi:MarR family winged helix-turn-helix transcriptional regulator [Microbacterium sp. AK031]|uniref:MarR family winged helix-turn-helix transcriptional regulator n=1 Tax=Microbacterium sp. AK031 TaxID=2723076 RepID=UPI00216745ED|nr:MarR family transcriptional regulator [Microbacterium sp. AK031]MCS3844168.1 DNA-binding MarR family transcriptional regulator [Microbacterium sp. AK031]
MPAPDEAEPVPFASGSAIYDVDVSDPEGELVDRAGMSEEDVRDISDLMQALGGLRDAEQKLSEASLLYMKLNQTDMRALHFLIACENRGIIATPGAISAHLGISTASTTKLLDRLERGGHITRSPHPSDRRALAIAITPITRRSAIETVGRQHARRFIAAARLSSDEREVVRRFLVDMTTEIALGDEPWANSVEERTSEEE